LQVNIAKAQQWLGGRCGVCANMFG